MAIVSSFLCQTLDSLCSGLFSVLCLCQPSAFILSCTGRGNRGAEEAGTPSQKHQVGANMEVRTGKQASKTRHWCAGPSHGASFLSKCPGDLCVNTQRGGRPSCMAVSMVYSSWEVCVRVSARRWVATFEKPSTDPSAFTEPATTVLSPYLKFGCLSARLFHQRCATSELNLTAYLVLLTSSLDNA